MPILKLHSVDLSMCAINSWRIGALMCDVQLCICSFVLPAGHSTPEHLLYGMNLSIHVYIQFTPHLLPTKQLSVFFFFLLNESYILRSEKRRPPDDPRGFHSTPAMTLSESIIRFNGLVAADQTMLASHHAPTSAKKGKRTNKNEFFFALRRAFYDLPSEQNGNF